MSTSFLCLARLPNQVRCIHLKLIEQLQRARLRAALLRPLIWTTGGLFLFHGALLASENVTEALTLSAKSESVITLLRLQKHLEGGYFRRTFLSEHSAGRAETALERKTMSSIYYLLTSQSPVGHFHLNKSDIIHYFHMGDPITYFLIYPDGELQIVTLGHNIEEGNALQLVVPGGVWKASSLESNGSSGYGLISEAVTPSFDYEDMTLGSRTSLKKRFPKHSDLIDEFSYPYPR